MKEKDIMIEFHWKFLFFVNYNILKGREGIITLIGGVEFFFKGCLRCLSKQEFVPKDSFTVYETCSMSVYVYLIECTV